MIGLLCYYLAVSLLMDVVAYQGPYPDLASCRTARTKDIEVEKQSLFFEPQGGGYFIGGGTYSQCYCKEVL